MKCEVTLEIEDANTKFAAQLEIYKNMISISVLNSAENKSLLEKVVGFLDCIKSEMYEYTYSQEKIGKPSMCALPDNEGRINVELALVDGHEYIDPATLDLFLTRLLAFQDLENMRSREGKTSSFSGFKLMTTSLKDAVMPSYREYFESVIKLNLVVPEITKAPPKVTLFGKRFVTESKGALNIIGKITGIMPPKK